MAGEVGHVVIDPNGHPCGCGLRGCAEALAAGPAIAREALARVAPRVLAAHDDGSGRPVAALFAAATAGDADARALVREIGLLLARTVHALVMTYDLERVVLGGGVSKVGRPLQEAIEQGLDEMRGGSPLAREMLPPGVLRLAPPDFDAGCWGAISLAVDATATLETQPA